MSDDLVAFLRARYDDDERYARTIRAVGERLAESGQTAEFVDGEGFLRAVMADPDASQVIEQFGLDAKVLPPNDISRLLADIDAKREILAEHRPAAGPANVAWQACATCHDVSGWPASWPCQTVRLLTAVYGGHPRYRAAWEPG